MSQKQVGLSAARFVTSETACFVALVLLSFVVLFTQNPSSVLPRTTLYFDAAHYLETCKRLYETCGGFFAAGFKVSRAELDSLAFYLLLDGPVLPGAGALLFFLLHKVPALIEWQSLVAMQCFFQAMCSGFLYLLGRTLLRQRWLCALLACAWTCYPSTISSCNSYLTEPLACALTVGFVLLAASLNQASSSTQPAAGGFSIPALKYFGAGVFLSLLALLKPALAPAAGLILFVSFVVLCFGNGSGKVQIKPQINRRNVSPLFFVILGIVVTFAPWFAFSFAARGTLTFLPSRRPVYNITTGCNIEGDGWGCYPTHPLALMFDDNEPAMPVLLALSERSPAEISNLMLRKITRIWNLPWNDYRYKILGLDFRMQALYHLLVVCAGFSGLVLLLARVFVNSARELGGIVGDSDGSKSEAASSANETSNNQSLNQQYSEEQHIPQGALDTSQKVTVISIAILMVAHLIYLPFECISRYGITSMPFVFLGAFAFLQQLLTAKPKKVLYTLASLAFVIAVFKLDLVPFVLFLTRNANTGELICALIRTVSTLTLSVALWKLSAPSKVQASEPPVSTAGPHRAQQAMGAERNVFPGAEKSERAVLALSCATFVVLSALSGTAFAVSNRESALWQCKLKNGSSANRDVLLKNSNKGKADWALLIIDGDQHLSEAKYLLNGVSLKNPVRSIYQFDSEGYELEDWLNQFASLIRKSPDSIRRWRAIEVPLALVKDGWNRASIESPTNGSVTVYGDYRRLCENACLMLPSPNEVSPGKFFNDSEDAFDSRIVQSTLSPIAESKCTLTQGDKSSEKDLSPAPGVQLGDYRLYLVLGYKHVNATDAHENGAAIRHELGYSINSITDTLTLDTSLGACSALHPSTGAASDGAQPDSPASSQLRKANSTIANEDARTSAVTDADLPVQLNASNPRGKQYKISLPPDCLSASHFGVHITGRARSKSSTTSFSVAGTVSQKERLIASVLPGTPCLISTSQAWKEFSVQSELPSQSARGSSPAVLQIELKPVNADCEISNLHVVVESLQKPQFAGHSIRYF